MYGNSFIVDTSEQLLQRLTDYEDRFTERKLEGARSSEFKKAMVAFANSLPPNRTGVLFIGVADSSDIRGVQNPDKLQKTIRNLAENECYPPIWVDIDLLDTGSGTVVAVVVSYSTKKPHFTGPAYIRRGSESLAATEDLYRELLLTQDDKRRWLLEHKEETWTVLPVGKGLGDENPYPQPTPPEECSVIEVTPHFVRLRVIASGRHFTERLESVNISYDDVKRQPKLVVKYRP